MSWNETTMRCVARNDRIEEEEAIEESLYKTINVVPASFCDNTNPFTEIPHPYYCYGRITCTGNGMIPYHLCSYNNSQCYNWKNETCVNCENTNQCDDGSTVAPTIPPQTTTTSATTQAPGMAYIGCMDTFRTAEQGNIVKYTCELRNIAMVTSLSVSRNNIGLYYHLNETRGITGTVDVDEGVTFSLGIGYLNVSVETTCDTEGIYKIEVNNVTDAELTLALTAEAGIPQLHLQSMIYLNQKTDITCTGNVGRNENGDEKARLSFEIRSSESSTFKPIGGGIEEERTESNCVITSIAKVSVYFTEDFNRSSVRCVATTGHQSEVRNITLMQPLIYFSDTSISRSIGSWFSLACNVRNVPDVTKLSVVKDGIEVASIESDGTTSSISNVEILDSSVISSETNILTVNISNTFCSSKGDYICESLTTSDATMSTKAKVTIHRKPSKPNLELSLQIIENVGPWLEFPTVCSAEVGYPRGTLSLETDKDGGVFNEITNTAVEYDVNDDACSTTAKLVYFNTYDMSWDNTTMRCVARNDKIDGVELIQSVSKVVNVVPASSCDDQEPNTELPHPHYCYGRLTCTENNIIPYHMCNKNNSLCYDWETNTCVAIENENQLLDFGEAETVPIGEPFIVSCLWDNSIANASAKIKRPSSSSDEDETVLSYTPEDGVLSHVGGISGEFHIGNLTTSNTLSMTFNEVECDDEAVYVCELIVDGDTVSEASKNISVSSPPEIPYLTLPRQLILDEPTEWTDYLSCQGNIGYPARQLQLEYTKPTEKRQTGFSLGTKSVEVLDVQNCTSTAIISYSNITFDLSWNNTVFKCIVQDGENVETESPSQTLHLIQRTSASKQAHGMAYIGCMDTFRIAEQGNIVKYTCELKNIAMVTSLSVSRNNIGLYDHLNEMHGITGTVEVDEDVTLSLVIGYLIVSVEATCDTEGIYKIEVNSATVAELTLALTAEAGIPQLHLQRMIYLNQKTDITCTGNVGRSESGDEKARLSFEIRSLESSTFKPIGGGIEEERTESNCVITSIAKVSVYFTEDFNCSSVRCIATTGHQSEVRNITLMQPLIYFSDTSISRSIGVWFSLACNVRNVPDVTKLSLLKDGIEVASIESDGTTSSISNVEILNYSVISSETNTLTVNISNTFCSSKGDYICESLTTSNATMSTKAKVTIQSETVLSYTPEDGVINHVGGISGESHVGSLTTSNTLSMTFNEVDCDDKAVYVCELIVDGDTLSEANKNISVSSPPEIPYLTLPRQLILDEPTEWTDYLSCQGNMGYPARQLHLEYTKPTEKRQTEFSLGTKSVEVLDVQNCTSTAIISYSNITFDLSWNNTVFKCIVKDGENVETESPSQTLRVIPNDCSASNNDQSFIHPHDCHLYSWCHNNGIIEVNTCETGCPDIQDGVLISCSDTCNC